MGGKSEKQKNNKTIILVYIDPVDLPPPKHRQKYLNVTLSSGNLKFPFINKMNNNNKGKEMNVADDRKLKLKKTEFGSYSNLPPRNPNMTCTTEELARVASVGLSNHLLLNSPPTHTPTTSDSATTPDYILLLSLPSKITLNVEEGRIAATALSASGR